MRPHRLHAMRNRRRRRLSLKAVMKSDIVMRFYPWNSGRAKGGELSGYRAFGIQRLVELIEEGVRRHGPTPKGLWGDKNSEENEVRRFDALFDMIDRSQPRSLLDLGCGVGLASDIWRRANGWAAYAIMIWTSARS